MLKNTKPLNEYDGLKYKQNTDLLAQTMASSQAQWLLFHTSYRQELKQHNKGVSQYQNIFSFFLIIYILFACQAERPYT